MPKGFTMWQYLLRRRNVTRSVAHRWLQPRTMLVMVGIMLTSAASSAVQSRVALAQEAQQAPTPVFSTIADAAGRFALDAPAAWRTVTETEWIMDGKVVGSQVTATPDLAAFYADWGVPGVIVSYSELLTPTMTLTQVLDLVDLSAGCGDGGRQPFSSGPLTGYVQRWERCGNTTTSGTVATITTDGVPQFYATVEIYTTNAADQPIVDQILSSFVVTATTTANTEPQSGALTTPTAGVSAPPSRPGLAYTFASRRDPAVVALLAQEFDDVASEPWLADTGQPLGHMLAAAPDLTAFRTTWAMPGIVVRTALSLTRTLDAAALLADSDLQSACGMVERSERIHITPEFTYNLMLDTYTACGGGATTYVLAVAQSDPADHLLFIEFQAPSAADRAALDIFLDSFAVDRAATGGAEASSAVAASANPVAVAPTPTPFVQPRGTVLANNLNVRSGPGTEFERLGAAPRDSTLAVLGQFENCAWLRVVAPTNLEGWVSGDAQFITLDTPCAEIPAIQP